MVDSSSSFTYDLFLSHSSKDKITVRNIAKRLLEDGLKVWFDEWMIRPGDNIPAKIEEGLERSRVLVFCMSENAFGSDWSMLESGIYRFRDPLNRERRFIPLRLDLYPIKGSLSQFSYIDWCHDDDNIAYTKLFEACKPYEKLKQSGSQIIIEVNPIRKIKLSAKSDYIFPYSFNIKRKVVLTGGWDGEVRLWDIISGRLIRCYPDHLNAVNCVCLSEDLVYVLSGSDDNKLILWDFASGDILMSFNFHTGSVYGVIISPDNQYIFSCSSDMSIYCVDIDEDKIISRFYGHRKRVTCIALSPDNKNLLSGSDDHTLMWWDVNTGKCLRVLEGHKDTVWSLSISSDGRYALSTSSDKTIRLWDLHKGTCNKVLHGHDGKVWSVAISPNNQYALSGSSDKHVRLWDLEKGSCIAILAGHENDIYNVVWSEDGMHAYSGDSKGNICDWDLSNFNLNEDISTNKINFDVSVQLESSLNAPEQVQYTNAKVLLVGESGVGKTGLSKRLALNQYEVSDSTVGAWATQWKLPVSSDDGVEKEIWLWDFGGQSDQRLIHQLYMDETALAVLVFDGQKEDLFEILSQWDRGLIRASRKFFTKILVAGRTDASGLRFSKNEILKFTSENNFIGFVETSAKYNKGCDELKELIQSSINWNEIPCRTTEVLFKRLKEEIVSLKDEGRVLMRFKELRETLYLRLAKEYKRIEDDELHSVLSLLTGPGVVWELEFGSWILLQPERINAYAQAVIRTLQGDEYQRGCLLEESVLKGELQYESSMIRLESEEERFVLLAMHQTLVERGLCIRQSTEKGNLLIFPSYYRTERLEQKQCPAVLVSYNFSGFLDEIYATLIVKLHYCDAFKKDKLWKYAADFMTHTGKQMGVKMIRHEGGVGEYRLYFDSAIPTEEKIIFSKYVHEHLLQHAKDVERLRHYICPHCGEPVENRQLAMKRLNGWMEKSSTTKPTIICVSCEKRVPLWDEIEECFASPKTLLKLRLLQEQANRELDNESKERALVGEVISTVALAGQISREFNVSDHGIDMEIEFKNDENEATGRRLYLQLKSGDSYLYERMKDGKEIFTIKNERHIKYWQQQAYPVMLVIRTSDGQIRWMDITRYFHHKTEEGINNLKQIVFSGERFDVMSIRKMREIVISH